MRHMVKAISRECKSVSLGALSLILAGCATETGTSLGNGFGVDGSVDACTVPTAFIIDGGPGVDGIPALTDPEFVSVNAPGARYLRDFDRVIGIRIGDEELAVPLNIGWWHEVVNLQRGPLRLSITHCPLTGSSLVFDRTTAGGAEFGVSGLLFMNNLMLFDRNTPSSLWPQMARGARCGPRSGAALPMYPSVEMSWLAWRTLHPTGTVISSATGHTRDYQSYPYGEYDVESNPQLLGPNPAIDARRPPKERVLGIVTLGGSSLAVPFGVLRALGEVAVVPLNVGEAPVVVFWERRGEVATAFVPQLDGTRLTFHVTNGRIRDEESGSLWSVEGVAIEGPHTGRRLSWMSDSFVAYWFAWASFHPATLLWTGAT